MDKLLQDYICQTTLPKILHITRCTSIHIVYDMLYPSYLSRYIQTKYTGIFTSHSYQNFFSTYKILCKKRKARIPRILAISTMYKIMYKRYIDKSSRNLVNTRILSKYLLPIMGRYVNQACIRYANELVDYPLYKCGIIW